MKKRKIEKRRMGRYGLEVPTLCLGTMVFGFQVDEAASRDILDKAFDNGLVFLDTSDAYPSDGRLDTMGETEAIIGRWIKDRGNRDRLLISTKCYNSTRPGPSNWGLSRIHIMEAIDGSLKRLGTDYIDLYLAHGFDPFTPIEETLRAFEDLVTSGKVRYVGCSNYSAWRLSEAIRAAEKLNVTGYICSQSRYNLLYRDVEMELLPLCVDQGLGVMVYNPLAGGFLSGKHKPGKDAEEGSRFADFGWFSKLYQDRYWQEAQFNAVEKLKAVVEGKGLNMVSVATAWVLAQPGITTALIGASKPEQLDANIDALDVTFDEELTAACEEVWWSLPRQPITEGYR